MGIEEKSIQKRRDKETVIIPSLVCSLRVRSRWGAVAGARFLVGSLVLKRNRKYLNIVSSKAHTSFSFLGPNWGNMELSMSETKIAEVYDKPIVRKRSAMSLVMITP